MATPGDCIVVDAGSGTVKAGFAGEVGPRVELQPLVGWRADEGDPGAVPIPYIGSELRAVWPSVRVARVVERGRVVDWTSAEALLDFTVRRALGTEPAQHPVLITEPALNTRADREMLTEVLMERVGCAGLYLSVPAVLSLYSMGRTSGVVLDVGYGQTSVVPVFQGYQLRLGTRTLPIGGADLTERLMQMLVERGFNLDTIIDLPTVNAMKEQLAYVAGNFNGEMAAAAAEGVPRMREEYTLPDGASVCVDKERFLCAEALFQPTLIGNTFAGIHVTIVEGVIQCDRHVHELLFDYVLLSGGSTCIKGLEDRLYREMVLVAPPTKKIRVVSPKPASRRVSSWVGGAAVASLASFSQSCVQKWEYDEVGPSVVHRKCF